MSTRIVSSPLFISLLVFAGLLGMTQVVVRQLNARTEAAADLRYSKFATDTSNKIQGQLLRYVDILPGIKGLWRVTEHPTRKEFVNYAASLNTTERFPSLVNLNFADYIKTADTLAYERSVRISDSDPQFTVHPTETKNEYRIVIRYTAPFNRRYTARDIAVNFPEDVAVTTINRADPYTSGEAVTQLDGRKGVGFGIRLALYKGGITPPPAERASMLVGSAGIFVDASTLIHEAIPSADWKFLSLTLRSIANAGEVPDKRKSLLFSFINADSHGLETTAEQRTFEVAGRRFALEFQVPRDYFKDPVSRNINAIGYLAGVSLSFCGAAIIYLLLASQKQLSTTVSSQSESLATTKNQVSKLLRERLQAEQEITQQGERERQQIGRELHDDLGQKLTGASLLLGTLVNAKHGRSDAEQEEVLHKVSAIVESGIHTIRTLSRGLTPFDGSPHDLAAALRELCGEVGGLLADGCRLAIAYDTELLSKHASLHLYRIVQESISNALRHGRATHIEVDLQDVEGRVSLTIRDNGKGFPPSINPSEPPTSSLGLRSIRSRAHLLGMKAVFSNNETGGTSVKVE